MAGSGRRLSSSTHLTHQTLQLYPKKVNYGPCTHLGPQPREVCSARGAGTASLRVLRVKRRSALVSMDMAIQNRSRCRLVRSALRGGLRHSSRGRTAAPSPFNGKQQNQTQTPQKLSPNNVPPLRFRGAPANAANISSCSKQSRIAQRATPGLGFSFLISFLKAQSVSANSSQRQVACWRLLLGKAQGHGHAGG